MVTTSCCPDIRAPKPVVMFRRSVPTPAVRPREPWGFRGAQDRPTQSDHPCPPRARPAPDPAAEKRVLVRR